MGKNRDFAFLVAPSHHITKKHLENAEFAAGKLGLRLKYGKSILEKYMYYAGSPERRALEIKSAFQDKESKIVLCATGGNGALEILQFLDFDALKKNPKALIGFSDITILLNAISQRTGIVTVHGPNQTHSWKALSEEELESIRNCIHKKAFGFQFSREGFLNISSGRFMGISAGGCLSLVVDSIGTPYEIDCRDKILFLEDTDVLGRRLYMLLVQMHLAGKFSDAKFVVLGSFFGCQDGDKYVRAFFEKYSIPCVKTEKFGHGKSNFAFPIGAKCSVDVEKCTLEFNFPT